MTWSQTVRALNDLLFVEGGSLAPRLMESSVCASSGSIRLLELVRGIARTSRRNCELITELILDLDGQPGPRPCDLTTAALHFQEVCSVYPRLLQSQERVVAAYRAILARLGNSRRAAALGNQLLTEHERELGLLRAANPVAAAQV